MEEVAGSDRTAATVIVTDLKSNVRKIILCTIRVGKQKKNLDLIEF